ncbi:MAG: abortive infection family protein [Blastococcus sp.]
MREVFNYATDHDPSAGLRLARRLIPSLRATNAFVPETPGYAGEQRIATLRAAFRRIGWDLDETGGLRPLVVDNLTGTELTEALRSYVQRANLNPDDASLQVGNGKDLDEAAARHVINELAGSYSTSANFPYTLTQAFTLLQLAPAAASTAATLDPDPHKAVQQCLFQLACAVNRLRNEVGTGHGRPAPAASALTPSETHVVTRATALVAGLLLDNL